MKYWWICIIIFILVVPTQGQSENLVLVSKVDKDSVSIKWLPSNFSQLKNMADGATIYRIEASKSADYKSLNYNNGKKWVIESTKKKYEQLGATVENEKFKALLDPLFESSNSKELENFAFGVALIENIVNPEFQFVLGNIIVDKEFDKTKTYVYKIDVKDLNSSYVFINPSTTTSYSSIDDLNLSLDKKKTVNIEWSSKRYEKEAFGFHIEHALDTVREGDFITETPYLPFTSEFEKKDKNALFRDNAIPGHYHYYRIHGIDMFGVKSLVSDWKKIYVPLLINAWSKIDTIYATKNKRIVKGFIHYKNLKSANLIEVSLMRSLVRDSGYQLVQTLSFSDSIYNFELNQEKTGEQYYYKLIGTNKDDIIASVPYYFFTLDQEPPAPPTGITGTIDSVGVVKLKWAAPLDKDIKGYTVHRANSKKEEFVEKTIELSKQLFFIDTVPLNNLTQELYYYIKSVDNNYNQSLPSDTALILKPDTIPPVSAIISQVEVKKMQITISWINSSSLDLSGNYLLRSQNKETDTIYRWNSPTQKYIDSTLIAGKYYSYQIITLDKNGNLSLSNSFTKYFEPGFRKAIKNFNASINIEQKAVLLSWEKPNDKVYSYKLYRGKPEQKLTYLTTITENNVTEFSDRNVKINNKYIYTVKYVNEKGIHSIPAKLEVIYQ